MLEKKSDREKREKLDGKVKAFQKELMPLLQKHGVVMAARPMFLQDGRIGAQTIYYDAEEIERLREKQEDNKIIEE